MPITWHKRTEVGTLQEVFSAKVSYMQNSMFCRLIDSLLDLTLPPLRTASQNKWSCLKSKTSTKTTLECLSFIMAQWIMQKNLSTTKDSSFQFNYNQSQMIQRLQLPKQAGRNCTGTQRITEVLQHKSLTWNGSQEDTAFDVFVDILIALGFERWSCRQDGVECLEVVCFTLKKGEKQHGLRQNFSQCLELFVTTIQSNYIKDCDKTGSQNQERKGRREDRRDSPAFWSLHGFKFFSSSTASHFAPVPRMVILEGKKRFTCFAYLNMQRF